MTYLTLLKKYWYLVAIVVVLVTIGSFLISVVQKPEYRSSVRLLVIQKQAGQLDAYTAARSAETVAGILSKMIYTSTFFDQVMTAGFNVDQNSFADNPENRKKEWERAVVTKVIEDSGTIQISVYDQNRHQAEQLSYAIAYVMISKGDQYHGGDNQIEIKMVDNPVTSEKPVRPSIMRNTLAGFILGLLASLSVMFLISERVQRQPTPEGLEAVTMPKPKEIKKWSQPAKKAEKPKVKKPVVQKKEKVKKELAEKPIPTQPTQPTQSADVGQRFAKSIADSDQVTRDIPYELPKKKVKKDNVPSPDMGQQNIKSKLAKGMDQLKAPPERAKLAPGEIVYQLAKGARARGGDQSSSSAQNDKYSPDRVDRWIKTGKFE
ncbi:MAG: Wzz/FepE/Etk N-terminal domain-containing protein [Parcubacteria group bacterium]